MTETRRTRRANPIKAGAIFAVAVFGAVNPAAAQDISGQVSSCLIESSGSINLGDFDSIGDALAASKNHSVPAGKYAVVMVGSRKIAIDSSRSLHLVVETPCNGSGPGLKPPE